MVGRLICLLVSCSFVCLLVNFSSLVLVGDFLVGLVGRFCLVERGFAMILEIFLVPTSVGAKFGILLFLGPPVLLSSRVLLVLFVVVLGSSRIPWINSITEFHLVIYPHNFGVGKFLFDPFLGLMLDKCF